MKTPAAVIAQFKKPNRWPVTAVVALTGLALVALTDAQTASGVEAVVENAADEQAPPAIVATVPPIGATDVDPDLAEITVTFDRDMARGFSWTGGGPDYPPIAEGKKIEWRDQRTCVLPVQLEAGHYYRVGINSKNHLNFKSAQGVPASPSAISFTTQVAGKKVKQKTIKPHIVALQPANGNRDVDPNLTELRVTFDIEMGGGCSWTGGGSDFPATPADKGMYWTDDRKTCVLPVQLEAGKDYRLGLNSPSHNNFQSSGGVPLEPVEYTFRTRDL